MAAEAIEETQEETAQDAEQELTLPTRFLNENGREYIVKVTVPIAHKFCRENKIKLEGLNPLLLDISQILDLAFLGTRSSKYIQLGEKKSEFMNGLEGRSFSEAQACTVNALVNFSLRTLPAREAQTMREEIRRGEEMLKAGADLQKSLADLGTGGMYTESAEVSEQIQTPPPAPSENLSGDTRDS